MAENDAPERIWVPLAALQHGGGAIYSKRWSESDVEFTRADLAAPDATRYLHFEFVANATAPACGIDDIGRRLRRTRLADSYVVDCPDCRQVLVGYRMGRAHVDNDAVREARRGDALSENLRGVLYQTALAWIEAHPYLKSKLEQGDVGDLTARLAAALRAEGEKGEGDD